MNEDGSLFAWRSGARGEFEVRDARKRTASGGDPCGVVLEFKFPSRIIASKQSMTDRRRAPRGASTLACLTRGKYACVHVMPRNARTLPLLLCRRGTAGISRAKPL